MFQSISLTDGHCYWVVASTGPILSFININRYKNRYLIRVWCIQKRRPKRSRSCKGDFMVFSLVALQCIGCDNDCYLDDFSETEDFSRQNPPLRLTSLLERAHKNWWPSNIRTMIIIIMGVEIMALVSHDDDKLTLSFFNWQTLAFCAVFLDLIADTHTSTQFCPLHQTSIKLWVSDPSNLSKADSNIHFFRHKPIQVLEVHSQSLHSILRYISHLSFSAGVNYKEGFLGPGEISAYGWLGRGGCKENRKVVNSCHAPLFSNWSVRASHPAQPSASFLHWEQLTLVADQLVRTKVVEKETPQYWSKARPGWNRKRHQRCLYIAPRIS